MHAVGFLLGPEYVEYGIRNRPMAQHTDEEVMTGFYKLVVVVEKLFLRK